jgi:hypothetical protein
MVLNATNLGDDGIARMCTRECGRLTPPREQDLVEAFEIAARDAFAFLTPAYDLEPSTMTTFDLDDTRHRTPVPVSDVRYPFLAVVEFTGAHPPVRISYGEREYYLELEIAANGTLYHPLASWMDALGIEFEGADDSGVATPTALARHARRLAGSLRDHFGAVCQAGTDVTSRLGSLGAKTSTRLHRTRDRAHGAFANGDYETYIELLEPFESALTVTERRKLEFARDKSAA